MKIYPPNSSNPIQAVAPTEVMMNPDGTFDLWMNTATSPNLTLKNYGLEYNNPNKPLEHYKIVWFVKDACGNITSCVDKVRLEDCKQPTPVCINGLSTVPMPSTGSITIWAKDFDASSFDNCTPDHQLRFSFSGTVYQPSRLFSCDDILALGVELPIDIWVWDNWNNKDFCSTTIVFTDPSGICGLPMGGISGLVTTPEQNATVTNVGVSLIKEGEVMDSFTTAADGSFFFPVVPAGQMYSLEADRSDDPRNGVTTLDLVKLQKHILGSEPLTSPYQMIAADANNSSKVSAIDLIEIRKLILGRYDVYPNNKSWRFIPADYVFADPYDPWPFEEEATFMVDSNGIVEDFVGVKIGDLNHSVNASFHMVIPRSEISASVSIDDRIVSAGEIFKINLDMTDFNQYVLGGQWDIKITGARLTNVNSLAPGMTDEMIYMDASSLRCAWTTENPVLSSSLMTLELEALTSGMISKMIEIDNSFFSSEIYDENEEVYKLDLIWKNGVSQEQVDQIQLHQNRPNPWDDQTVIPFELPEAGEVTLSITNAIGEEVTSIVRHFSSGTQQFKILNESWPAGMYYYTLRIGDTQLTKTMLILNKR